MTEEVVRQLGNYRLTDLLGQGGFAKVYLGEHVYLQMKAAVKVLQARVSGPDDIDSFLKEAKIIAHLAHPHIVRVLDFGMDSETPFLVMDYAPNGTLRQRHPKKTQLSLPTIVSYVKQVADALQYSHNERLIHRDVKPENMLIGQRNEILLSDFGIALVTQSSRYQSTEGVVGTVPYMSPEHIQGKARPASDQYSLGIAVYEWLSGDRPFHGSFVELCTQHLFSPVPPLREKVPTILPEVEQVVLKALAKDPKQRFDSVQAFADALERASQLVPKSLPQSSLGNISSRIAILQISPLAPKSLPQSLSDSASTPFAENSPVSDAFSLNLQTSSKQQVVKQIPQERRIAPKSTDMTIHILERARKRGASLAEIVPKSADMSINTRSVGQREIILIILGIVIFGILKYDADQLIIHKTILFSGSIGNLPYFPSYGDLLFRGLAFALALFLGVKFGPWAGCACVLIGSLSVDILTGYILQTQWYQYVTDTLITFISGLSPLSTYGRYNTKKSVCIATLMSFLGIFVGNYFLASVDHFTVNSFTSEFIALVLTNVIGSLIPLIILLIIDERFISRREQKAHRISGTRANGTATGIESS